MPLTAFRSILFAATCCCAAAVAQPAAAEAPICGPTERTAFAPIAGRGIAELRGFLFAKKQLDQLAQYLESKEGAVKWAGATPASRLQLMEAAARSATISGSAATQLPFLSSTRYAFEGQFPFECSKSAQLLAQMREPSFTRYLEVRARVAAAAADWYARGLFAKLPHGAAAPLLRPFAVSAGDIPSKSGPAKARPSGRKSATAKPTPAERKMFLAKRHADVDLLLREIGVFGVGMTAIEDDLLLTGASATVPTDLLNEAVEVLADPNLKSLFLDPAYRVFNYAVMITAHNAEPLLIQDYPHLEPLSRNMGQAWAADLLRAAPKPLRRDPKSEPVASDAPIAPIPPVAPVAPKP